MFQASVGNLPPGKEALRQAHVCDRAPGRERTALRFTIPTTVSPRYAPAEDLYPHRPFRCRGAESSGSHGACPMDSTSPYASPCPAGLPRWNHRRTRSASPSTTAIGHGHRLRRRKVALDREFVLSIARGPAWTPRRPSSNVMTKGSETIACRGRPSLPTDGSVGGGNDPFVVYGSGFDGRATSSCEVRNALQLCLRSLIARLLASTSSGSATRYESLFHQRRASTTSRSLDLASRHVEGLRANLGRQRRFCPRCNSRWSGPALKAHLPRQVIVLTDGQVTNTDAVLALGPPRTAANLSHLHAGHRRRREPAPGARPRGCRAAGAAEFIYPGERIEPKVLRLLGRALVAGACRRQARVERRRRGGDRRRHVLPPVFAGGRVLALRPSVIGGACQPAANIGGRPRNRAIRTGARSRLRLALVLRCGRPAGPIATLAARARIRELEESDEWSLLHVDPVRRKENRTASCRILSTTASRYGAHVARNVVRGCSNGANCPLSATSICGGCRLR